MTGPLFNIKFKYDKIYSIPIDQQIINDKNFAIANNTDRLNHYNLDGNSNLFTEVICHKLKPIFNNYIEDKKFWMPKYLSKKITKIVKSQLYEVKIAFVQNNSYSTNYLCSTGQWLTKIGLNKFDASINIFIPEKDASKIVQHKWQTALLLNRTGAIDDYDTFADMLNMFPESNIKYLNQIKYWPNHILLNTAKNHIIPEKITKKSHLLLWCMCDTAEMKHFVANLDLGDIRSIKKKDKPNKYDFRKSKQISLFKYYLMHYYKDNQACKIETEYENNKYGNLL